MSQLLLTDLTITPDGDPLPTHSGSGRIANWLGFEREAVPATVGDHASSEVKVVPTITCEVLFTESFDPARLRGIKGVLVAASQGGRRILCHNSTIARADEIGGGPVGITIHVHGRIQHV